MHCNRITFINLSNFPPCVSYWTLPILCLPRFPACLAAAAAVSLCWSCWCWRKMRSRKQTRWIEPFHHQQLHIHQHTVLKLPAALWWTFLFHYRYSPSLCYSSATYCDSLFSVHIVLIISCNALKTALQLVFSRFLRCFFFYLQQRSSNAP